MIKLLTYSVTVVTLLFLLVIFLPIMGVPIQAVLEYSIVFNNLAVGMGALLAGIGSLRYIETYLERSKLANKKEKLRRKYPRDNLNKTYHLIWFRRGKLYLFDKNDMHYYHIQPWETAEELYFADVGKKVDFGAN